MTSHNDAPPEVTPGNPIADPYDPAAIESKWQARWKEQGTNHTNLESGAKPFYALMMFPYPSAEGLHVGNLFAFTGNDIFARFQRLQGYAVFEPLGYDAFGIHSENYAIKVGGHPMRLIPRNIANFQRQLERAGLMVDWRYAVNTTDPAYYKWTQWVFLQLLQRGLAYKKKAAVNWCPSCKTVLANEQVIAGACERCGTVVEQRLLEQWFFRIGDYAERLLNNLGTIDWSETTKTAQRNWIGKSEGAELEFSMVGAVTGESRRDPMTSARLSVFTTRPDTVFGATYIVLAPEHPLADLATTGARRVEVEAYRRTSAKQDVVARKVNKEKTGVFTGSYAVNPATGQDIPIWIADYVLMEYGTGAIMAVPGHDDRDFQFATAFGLPITRVVAADGEDASSPLTSAFVDSTAGRLVNSAQFDGATVAEGKQAITAWLAEKGSARPVVNYRLHDWCISRQRYWGPPIPIIYCDACGPQPVPEADLPVILPDIEDYRPDDSGVSPLARHAEWYHVSCPKCGKQGRRETDVSDTFLDSGWYFIRYPSANRGDVPFDKALTAKWLPVSSYIGGNEHAVLHLLYSRFITMVLHDMGHIDFDEPYTRFRAHGLIIKDGAKMSKTKGNVVVPDQFIEEWGADSFRTYLMFLGPYEEEGGDFRDAGISGARRFLDRLWLAANDATPEGAPDEAVMRKLHQTIRKVSGDVPKLSYNTAIAAMMEYMNVVRENGGPIAPEVEPMIQMVSPFAPHIAEELWSRFGHEQSVFDSGWPAYDEALARDESVQLAVQVNGKLRGTLTVARDITEDEAVALALAEPGVAKFIAGPLKKVIFVPGRLINLVV